MRKVVCDRCGREMFGRPSGRLWGGICTESYLTGTLRAITLRQKRREIDIDLCEDCTNELCDWLHVNDMEYD